MATQFIRAADGATVSDSEALDSGRRLKPGYRHAPAKEGDYIGFDMALLDSDSAGRMFVRDTQMTDAETAFRDSPEGREAIAYAKSCADLRNAHGGTRKWTAQDERSAIQAALITRDFNRKQVVDAAAARPALQAMEMTALRTVRDIIRDSRNQ